MGSRVGYTVRQLRSGRWQALVRNPDTGDKVSVGGTFETEELAEAAALVAQADMVRGTWFDRRRGAVRVDEYVAVWLRKRRATARHGERYAIEAERLVRMHIAPYLGHVTLAELTVPRVRQWHDDLTADRVRGTWQGVWGRRGGILPGEPSGWAAGNRGQP